LKEGQKDKKWWGGTCSCKQQRFNGG